MNKIEKYQKLIEKRQKYHFPFGLKNYGDTGFEINHVDAWELWHSDLNAEIMLVGQDFADFNAFKSDWGRVEPTLNVFKYKTNENLIKLFKLGLNLEIGHPLKPNKNQKLFFTNAVIGLKEYGGMQGKVSKDWVKKSSEEFLKPLIEVVQPKFIICLGKVALNSVNLAFQNQIEPRIDLNLPLENLVKKCFLISNKIKVFPAYHCGARVVNMNRGIDLQIEDWGFFKHNI